jgi:ABC-type lipoprotein release transport system permease subunit
MSAAYVTRFVENQLYAIEPLDVSTFAGAATGMFIVAGLAALVAARRAITTDPFAVLRQE